MFQFVIVTCLLVGFRLYSFIDALSPFPQHINAKAAQYPTEDLIGVNGISAKTSTTGSVRIDSEKHKLLVNGKPFQMRGIAYSPIPIGESPSFVPGGDYFTADYQYLWKRDFPLIKAMGANTIRVYSWSPLADHKPFLDALQASGLYAVVTYYLGTKNESPVNSTQNQQAVIDGFVDQVKRYGDHPAILMWMFGNELNGPWNGFMQQFNVLNNCKWTLDCTTNHDPNDACYNQIGCVYTALFNFLESAFSQAKKYTTRPMTTGFADLDNLIAQFPDTDRAPRFAHLVPSMDTWAVQLYRGKSFGDYFNLFAAEMNSSLIITEYGIDSYNDACGWPENYNVQPCANYIGDGFGGSKATENFRGCADPTKACALPGETTQSQWDAALTQELENQHDSGGPVLGGFLMSWVDEYWKGVGTQDQCTKQACPLENIVQCLTTEKAIYAVNGPAACTWKAHISCPNYNTTQQDLCGYWLSALPDGYVNEAHFGINEVTPCNPIEQHATSQVYNLNALRQRPVYDAIRQLWGGSGNAPSGTCDELNECYVCTKQHSIPQLMQNMCQQQCGFQFGESTLIGSTATGNSQVDSMSGTATQSVNPSPDSNSATASVSHPATDVLPQGGDTRSSAASQYSNLSQLLLCVCVFIASLLVVIVHSESSG